MLIYEQKGHWRMFLQKAERLTHKAMLETLVLDFQKANTVQHPACTPPFQFRGVPQTPNIRSSHKHLSAPPVFELFELYSS